MKSKRIAFGWGAAFNKIQLLSTKPRIKLLRFDCHFNRKCISTDRDRIEGVYFEGNDRFEGYSLDLIDGIAKEIGFHFKLEIVPDNAYGSFNKKTKKWNGLVKHLLDRVGDIFF